MNIVLNSNKRITVIKRSAFSTEYRVQRVYMCINVLNNCVQYTMNWPQKQILN